MNVFNTYALKSGKLHYKNDRLVPSWVCRFLQVVGFPETLKVSETISGYLQEPHDRRYKSWKKSIFPGLSGS